MSGVVISCVRRVSVSRFYRSTRRQRAVAGRRRTPTGSDQSKAEFSKTFAVDNFLHKFFTERKINIKKLNDQLVV